MKDLAQLDGWLRDGSAAFVNSLCEWSSYWRLSDTSKVSDSFFDLVLIMLALHHQKERL